MDESIIDENILFVICPNCLRTHEYPASKKGLSLSEIFDGNKIAESCLKGSCISDYGHDKDFGK